MNNVWQQQVNALFDPTHTHPSGLEREKSDRRGEKGKRGDFVIRLGFFVGGDGQMIGDRTTREEIGFDFCDGGKRVSKFEVSIRESASAFSQYFFFLCLGIP